MKIKELLLEQCKEFVEKRLQNIKATISSNQKALQSETKSSAGDKHETGRAMLQLEMEKAGQQLAAVLQMKELLPKINTANSSKTIHLGSIVETNTANYFLAISAGKLVAGDKTYFAVSSLSPIGKLLLGKQEKEVLFFNGKKIEIQSVF